MMSLIPLNLTSPLAFAPQRKPLYATYGKGLKGNSIDLPDPKATRVLLALMNQGAVNGGAACHWGGPSAMIEIWTVLHGFMFEKKDWFNHYNFVNDIGHGENGLYAIKAQWGFADLTVNHLKGFRSIESKLTGHGESHLFKEGVLLSNGPLSSALPQAQGLALADKLLNNNRLTICTLSDGAAMEGEAKEAFASIPGMAKKGMLNPFLLIVSDNNTKLGGRISEDSFSMEPTFLAMEKLGWKTIMLEDGHDLTLVTQTLSQVFQMIKADQPIFIWAKTKKGFGVESAVKSETGAHGFPLKPYDSSLLNFISELWGKDSIPKELQDWAQELIKLPEVKKSEGPKKDKIQIGVAQALSQAAAKNLPVFSISCDLAGSTGLKAFQKNYPNRFIDIGIAESNMVSVAAGLSKAGFIPVVDTFAAFGISKGNLPLIMAQLSDCPLIAIFSHTGFQDAADGASHQSLTYMSALASIPHLKLVNLSTAKEAEVYIEKAILDIKSKREKNQKADSYVFFLGRENFILETKPALSYELDQSQLLEKGEHGLIVATGSLVEEAMKAREELKKMGKNVAVIHHPFVNSKNVELIASELKVSSKKLVTVEDHQVLGGMGSILVHQLKLLGCEFEVKSLGVKGEFGQSSYTARELYRKHEMDATAIIECFKN